MSNRSWPSAAPSHAWGSHSRARFPKLALACLLLGVGVLAGTLVRLTHPSDMVTETAAPAKTGLPVRHAADLRQTLFDPGRSPAQPAHFAALAPLAAGLQRDVTETGSILPSRQQGAASAAMAALPQPPAQPAQPEPAPQPLVSVPLVSTPLVSVPLPVARPQGLVLIGPRDTEAPSAILPPKVPENARAVSRRAKTAAVATATPADNRNFIEKLFGVQPKEQGTQLAYAAPQDDVVDRSRNFRLTPAPSSPSGASLASRTAVYDIRARMVYMPNGERLEAHSGLGEKMDDIRHVHVRMHGPTPPHVYDLTEREALFHGVRAIRLNPVGGSAKIFGRAGLLAHSYLLGPRGDSNGCVSIKDYEAFLQAFLRGEVRRLIVVSGEG